MNMLTGSGKTGENILTPDGPGKIEKVFDADRILVLLDNGMRWSGDITECEEVVNVVKSSKSK